VCNHLLEFMRQVDAGVYPADWHEKPAWSMDYHYEGMFRHHIGGRGPGIMQELERQCGAPLTDEQMRGRDREERLLPSQVYRTGQSQAMSRMRRNGGSPEPAWSDQHSLRLQIRAVFFATLIFITIIIY
jgi:hypothetical protein